MEADVDRYKMMGGENAAVKAVRDPAGEWVRVEDLEWQIGQIQADKLAFASCNRARKAAEAECEKLREKVKYESEARQSETNRANELATKLAEINGRLG